MTTCGYAYVVLSGFLSSNGVIALILLYSVLKHNLYLGYIKTDCRPTRSFYVDRPKDEVLVG